MYNISDHVLSSIMTSKLMIGVNVETFKNSVISYGVDVKSYDKGRIIHFQGEVCEKIDMILHGKVVVQNIDENGNVLTIKNFVKGDSFGENLLYSNRNFYPMTVTSVDKTEILSLDKDLVMEMCQSDKEFLKNLLSSISEKAMILTSKIHMISLKSVRELIFNYLKQEYIIQKSTQVILNTTKKDLAEKMGIQRTSLSRELQKLKHEGILDFDSKSIIIKQLDVILKT